LRQSISAHPSASIPERLPLRGVRLYELEASPPGCHPWAKPSSSPWNHCAIARVFFASLRLPSLGQTFVFPFEPLRYRAGFVGAGEMLPTQRATKPTTPRHQEGPACQGRNDAITTPSPRLTIGSTPAKICQYVGLTPQRDGRLPASRTFSPRVVFLDGPGPADRAVGWRPFGPGDGGCIAAGVGREEWGSCAAGVGRLRRGIPTNWVSMGADAPGNAVVPDGPLPRPAPAPPISYLLTSISCARSAPPHRCKTVGGASGSESLRIGETPTLLEHRAAAIYSNILENFRMSPSPKKSPSGIAGFQPAGCFLDGPGPAGRAVGWRPFGPGDGGGCAAGVGREQNGGGFATGVGREQNGGGFATGVGREQDGGGFAAGVGRPRRGTTTNWFRGALTRRPSRSVGVPPTSFQYGGRRLRLGEPTDRRDAHPP
jgi:hypothetical protein